MSEYRDAKGRFRPMDGWDQMEKYGAGTLIVLILTGWSWVPPLLHWAIKEWPVQ